MLGRSLPEETVLWRYLDAAKFFDLLHNQKLFFCRGDLFEDKFEGAFTKSLKHAVDEAFRTNKIESTADEFKKKLRERVFVNCWHASANDSMAMWNLYGRSSAAVAVTTTVGKLRDAMESAKLNHEIYITRVEYVNHWHDPSLVFNPYSNVFAYKTVAYEYEKEVRVIIDRFHEDFDLPAQSGGMFVGIELGKLIRSIVVSPEAPSWFINLVEGVTEKYGILAPVRRSKLAFEPV